jgi:D-alanyl-D-alanine carboxypeptidase
VRGLAVLTFLVLLGVTAAPARAVPAAVDDALTRVVAEDQLPGGLVVVRGADGPSRHTAGFSDVDTRAGFAPSTHVRVASITKTFVAATVMQLVAEGKVDLDATIDTYLPGRVHGEGFDGNAITVRQLLRHQSGLPEYFNPGTEIPTEPVEAEQLLDAALAKPAQFPPGTSWEYTNTNYVIAGLIIEAVTGTPAVDEITRRVIAPLGLTETYFPAPGHTALRTPLAHGYELVDGRRTDVTAFNASAAGMSGSLVSTNEDTTTFITALLDGRVVPPAQLHQMMDTVEQPDAPGFRYGLGLASIDLLCGVTVWGHGGDIKGYHSLVVKPLEGEAVSVTFTQNPAAQSLLDDPRAAIVDALYCPTA